MKWLLLLAPGGCAILAAWGLIHRARQQKAWREAPNYRQAIQSWAPEKPMALPAIRETHAVVVPKKRTRRKKAQADDRLRAVK